MMTVFYLFIGFFLAAIFLSFVNRYDAETQRVVLAKALVVAAIIYIIFALVWGDTRWLLIESIGVPVYGLFAWLSLRFSVYWLSLGWLLHPIWDVYLHLLGPGDHIAPEWYAIACISFDLLVALYIICKIKYLKLKMND